MMFRKKILIPLICAAVLLTTGQRVMSESPAEESTAVDSQGSPETSTPETSEPETSDTEAPPAENKHITEEQALAAMKKYASTSALELYVNEETGAFAVKNLENGHYTWSNPYDAAADALTKSDVKRAELNSALMVNAAKVSEANANTVTILSARSGSKGDGDTTIEKIDGGFKAAVNFPDQGITVPYYVTLTDDHFDISVAIDEIHEVEFEEPDKIEESTRSVVDIGLFANLGAAYTDEKGYFVVPDGSGAIINFNNGKHGSSEYAQKIYGRDIALSQITAPAKTEQAYLPILGIVRENDALLEVVTEGAAYATAKASVSEQRATGYNAAYFEFSVRSSDQYFMGEINAAAMRAYEQTKIPESRVTVRYYPIAKQGASYVDIAKRYQKHLLDEDLMTKKDGSVSPLYVDLYGGTVKEQSVLGLPVKRQTAATTYSEAKEILEKLKELGVDDMVVTYNDFNKAGILDKISSSMDYAGKLGGKSDFKALKDYCATVGITLAPSVDLMEFERSGNGYSKTGSSVIGVTKAYATQDEYELAYGTPNDLKPSWFILSPSFFDKAYGNVISSFAAEGVGAASFGKGTSIVYSDFSQGSSKRTSRQQAVEYLKGCYEKVSNSGMTFVAGACNDYALKYVDMIRNVPLYSSGFDITDMDIPLYEMVIHGYIPYTTKAKNASSDAKKLLLMSMVTATPLHYEFMYEDPNDFTDSKYDTLFYTHYEGWLNQAAEEYKFFLENLGEAAGSPISDFKYTAENTVESSFENGTKISADLDKGILTINGKAVELPETLWKGATVD